MSPKVAYPSHSDQRRGFLVLVVVAVNHSRIVRFYGLDDGRRTLKLNFFRKDTVTIKRKTETGQFRIKTFEFPLSPYLPHGDAGPFAAGHLLIRQPFGRPGGCNQSNYKEIVFSPQTHKEFSPGHRCRSPPRPSPPRRLHPNSG